jgi:DUF1365 family protein
VRIAAAPAIYSGRLAHRRLGAAPHAFTTSVLLAYLDVDALAAARDQLPWGGGRIAPVHLRGDDYGPAGRGALGARVRDLVEARAGVRPEGTITLLTQLRTFGWLFNPISIYWCFAPDSPRVEHVVLEVTNTPWHERHAYVLPVAEREDGQLVSAAFAKALHVSPFLGMDQTYTFRATPPDDRLRVRLESEEAGDRVFIADLALHRRPFTRAQW